MRLDFNALWVDDQPGRVEAQIIAIKKEMQRHGFDFRPTMCTALAQVQQRISHQLFTDEVDLILVDWDLGNHLQGQSVISEIRERIRYKDVIFYSAQKNAEELRKLAFDSGAEGVYCAHRSDLVDEVVGVCESLTKKVLDLDHVRGIVMGATSDIDDMVLDTLRFMHERSDVAGQAAMLGRALAHIDGKVAEMGDLARQLRDQNTFKGVLASNLLFSANDRLRMLTHLLELECFKPHHGYRRAVVDYMKDVVPKRNRLGHRVLVPAGRPGAEDGEAEQMGLDETRALRCRLLELRAEFRGLLAALAGLG